MAVGLAIGLAGGYARARLLRAVSLPNEGLHAIRTLAAAGVIYGAASVAHGSGFLAVFIAGMIVGDVDGAREARHRGVPERARERRRDRRLRRARPDGDARRDRRPRLARRDPARALPRASSLGRSSSRRCSCPCGCGRGSACSSCGAASRAPCRSCSPRSCCSRASTRGSGSTASVFIVVAFSVIVQGASIPFAARRLGVPMRRVQDAAD